MIIPTYTGGNLSPREVKEFVQVTGGTGARTPAARVPSLFFQWPGYAGMVVSEQMLTGQPDMSRRLNSGGCRAQSNGSTTPTPGGLTPNPG